MPGQVVTIDVLLNDLDPDGDPTTLVVSSADPAVTVAGGQVSIVAGPTSSRHRYTVTDSSGQSDSADIAIIVVENRARW